MAWWVILEFYLRRFEFVFAGVEYLLYLLFNSDIVNFVFKLIGGEVEDLFCYFCLF